MKLITYISFSLITLVFISCNRKDEEAKPVAPVTTFGSLNVSFTHSYNDSTFELNKKYSLISGDTFSVNDLRYIISDITLIDTNYTKWKANDSYHIVNTNKKESFSFIIDSVPTGKYFKINFRLGLTEANLKNTALLLQNNTSQEIDSMLNTTKTTNLHLRLSCDYFTNESLTGSFTEKISVSSYSTTYDFGDLTPHRLAHNVPHTPISILIKENEITPVSFEAKINWLINSPLSIDFDDEDYINNMKTVLYTNYNSNFFIYSPTE